jgi:hypothetical protein
MTVAAIPGNRSLGSLPLCLEHHKKEMQSLNQCGGTVLNKSLHPLSDQRQFKQCKLFELWCLYGLHQADLTHQLNKIKVTANLVLMLSRTMPFLTANRFGPQNSSNVPTDRRRICKEAPLSLKLLDLRHDTWRNFKKYIPII